jgi:hypothetical protein
MRDDNDNIDDDDDHDHDDFYKYEDGGDSILMTRMNFTIIYKLDQYTFF